MTPNLILGLFPVTAPAVILMGGRAAAPVAPRRHATIVMGRYHLAQGVVLSEHGDGSLTIDTGDRILTGQPVNRPAARALRAI